VNRNGARPIDKVQGGCQGAFDKTMCNDVSGRQAVIECTV